MIDLFNYARRKTTVAHVGALNIGGENPVRIQSMTTTSTDDTEGSVAQAKRIIDAGGELVRLTTQGRAGAEEAFDGQVVMAFVGTDVEDVADAAVGRGHDLQAAEEDFGLLTVVFADVEVEPVAGLGVGQGRERGFLFGELAGCGFFRAFFVACVEGGIFFAESGGVDCRGGKTEGQEGETAHGVLQSENGFILWVRRGGVQVSTV